MGKGKEKFVAFYDNGKYTVATSVYDIREVNKRLEFLIYDSMFEDWLYIDSKKFKPL